ncbi:23S rRNA (guanosine(2251)-2'-O)-methyltransferase RlmB [Wenzhouxiangella sp. XN79A]|uniref:23S rRNA (guanosine(2251)-2'-O)-methyltransferase RlmB n=1 Tax=Wenzhouxiangella sp. XN79A TaxID=2724193 RepID=UPI00144A703D|nr:23S rRNA (guanosine(2251)-2'-O)-methyltransferase RlmB [Wenzhouxiangella sp. XN79A]NKI34045.1 23S rRNA (guanosine(2251)-2'-O)-methyltransferase RlmB [Wenzhouxiangella sp. XN79A]
MKREHTGGINAVEALIERSPERVLQLWAAGGNPRVQALIERARAAGIPVQAARPNALDKLAGGETHQGVVAEFRPAEPMGEAELDGLIEARGPDLLLLALDRVQDPHNLGACLRSAAAAGVDAVLVPRDRSAPLSPAARRAAAGAAERVPLVEVANLARALEHLKQAGVWAVGLAGDAKTALYDIDLKGPRIVVMGSEERGLRRLTAERCDELARIPMPGTMESLNVSVATGIALFEAVRQRGAA